MICIQRLKAEAETSRNAINDTTPDSTPGNATLRCACQKMKLGTESSLCPSSGESCCILDRQMGHTCMVTSQYIAAQVSRLHARLVFRRHKNNSWDQLIVVADDSLDLLRDLAASGELR